MKRVVVLLFSMFFLSPAHSQNWPAKPVKFIVPAGQGGTIDPLSRFFADNGAARCPFVSHLVHSGGTKLS